MKKAPISKKHHPTLIALAVGNKSLQQDILKHCDNSCIKIIAQIIANLIHPDFKLPKRQLKRLSSYAPILRSLRAKDTTLAQKRTLLIRQSGGFLPFILPLISAAVGGLINTVLSHGKT